MPIYFVTPCRNRSAASLYFHIRQEGCWIIVALSRRGCEGILQPVPYSLTFKTAALDLRCYQIFTFSFPSCVTPAQTTAKRQMARTNFCLIENSVGKINVAGVLSTCIYSSLINSISCSETGNKVSESCDKEEKVTSTARIQKWTNLNMEAAVNINWNKFL
jgi:hypothetical protein